MAERPNRKLNVESPAPAASSAESSTEFLMPGRTLELFQALVIFCVGIWISFPALQGEWIRDDYFYLDPSLLSDPARLWNIWFRPGSFIEYYPITQTVQWIQWKLWGDHVIGYHLTNLFLHVANAILVWRLLRKFDLCFAWVGGLLFLVHPVQVESVAWISELKNTLSLTPFLLSMMAWIDFEENRQARDYLLALGLFIVAMLCKITMAPFPVIILLYAWWKRGRLDGRNIIAAVPFFVVSLTIGSLNSWGSRVYAANQSLPSVGSSDFLSQIALAGTIVSFYFAKAFWPGDVMPMYPQWQIEPHTFFEFMPWFVMAALLVFLWTKRRAWGRHALLGLGFFGLNLPAAALMIPSHFLGLIVLSYMRFSWVMDHFLYLPIIGLIGLVVAGLSDLETRLPSARPVITGLATLVLTLMAFQSHAYSGAYADEVTFWNYALEYNPDAWGAHAGLGDALRRAGEDQKAAEQYELALAQRPEDVELHDNLSVSLDESGQESEAIEHARQAIALKPTDVQAHNNLGYFLGRLGRYSEAVTELEIALKLDPGFVLARENLQFIKDQEKAAADKK